jgi:putative ABC transport system substrate-binding protein
MRRREFITLLGGVVTALPLAAHAQQGERIRRIGVLTQYSEGDPAAVRNFAAFEQKMQDLGWTKGRNVAVEYRWTAARADRYRQFAVELVAMQPDVLVTSNSPSLEALLQATRTIPIVFTSVLDPVGSGLIESLARPGGNATGFELFEWGIGAKWIDLLKQIAPRDARGRGSRSFGRGRQRPAWRAPGRGAVSGCRVAPDRLAGRRQHRARHYGIRAAAERRLDPYRLRNGDG